MKHPIGTSTMENPNQNAFRLPPLQYAAKIEAAKVNSTRLRRTSSAAVYAVKVESHNATNANTISIVLSLKLGMADTVPWISAKSKMTRLHSELHY